MKYILLLITAIVVNTVATQAQTKVILNPKFSSNSSKAVRLEKVEHNDTVLRLHFLVVSPQYQPPVGDTDCYVSTTKSGLRISPIKLAVKKAAGNGGRILKYSVTFPALDEDAISFNYVHSGSAGFQIDKIILREGVKEPPKELQRETMRNFVDNIEGNWFDKANKLNWCFGIYDSSIIYDNQVWKFAKISNKGAFSLLELINHKQHLTTLILKRVGANEIEVGTSEAELKPCIRVDYTTPFRMQNNTANKQLKTAPGNNNQATIRGLVTSAEAIYNGFINLNTIWGSFKAPLNKKGYFEITIPAYFPQVVTVNDDYYLRSFIVSSYKFHNYFYVAPGADITILVDGKQYPALYADKCLFMGTDAQLNNLLVLLNKSDDDWKNGFVFGNMMLMNRRFENEKLDNLGDYHQVLYKSYINNNTLLHSLIASGVLTEGQQVVLGKIIKSALAFQLVTSKSVWKAIQKLNTENEEIDKLPVLHYDDSTFKAMLKEALADSALLYAINHRSMSYFLTSEIKSKIPKAGIVSFMDAQLKKAKPNFSDADLQLYQMLKEVKAGTIAADFNLDTLEKNTKIFKAKYKKELRNYNYSIENKSTLEHVQNYYGLPDWAHDLLLLTRYTRQSGIGTAHFTIDEKEFDLFKDSVKTKEMLALVDAEIKTNGSVGFIEGSKIKNTPFYEYEDLLYIIADSYKGKTILVDFWATWCKPCLYGMEYLALIKEQLKNEPVAFVTITGESSPTDEWRKMVKKIRGYHYQLNKYDWDLLSKRHFITTIPRYMIINKDGVLINDNYKLPHNFEELKKALLK